MPKKKKSSKQINFGCVKCYRNGYLVDKQGDYARAKICECIEKCEECNGLGTTLSTNKNGYTYIKLCNKCGELRKRVKLYNLARIPAKYYLVQQVDAGFKPQDQSQEEALQYAKQVVDRFPEELGFLMMGNAGLGKTHLAIGTISELTLQHGIQCIFKDFFYLLSELKEAYSSGTPENEVLFPLIDTEVLVIDELGKGRCNEWELNILDQLISKRYNSSKTTLVTTNFIAKEYIKEDYDITSLEGRVGDRIASRLYEMCKFIHIEGKDHRKKNRSY